MFQDFIDLIDELLDLVDPILHNLLHITASFQSADVPSDGGKNAYPHELEKNYEDFLTFQLPMNVTIAYGSSCRCHKVEGIHIDHILLLLLVVEEDSISPASFFLATNVDPDTCESVE